MDFTRPLRRPGEPEGFYARRLREWEEKRARDASARETGSEAPSAAAPHEGATSEKHSQEGKPAEGRPVPGLWGYDVSGPADDKPSPADPPERMHRKPPGRAATGQRDLNLNEAAKVSGQPSRAPGVLHFPEPEADLLSARNFNRYWWRVLDEGGAPTRGVQKVRGCATRGDLKGHMERSARTNRDGALCAAAFEVSPGRRVRIARPYRCSDRRLCAICAESHHGERAARVAGVFREFVRAARARKWDARGLDVEFTVPVWLRERLTDWTTHKAFMEACERAVFDTFREIYPDLEELGVVANVHPSSSSRPWLRKPHVHLLALNVGRFRRGPKWRLLRFSLRPHQLARLKEHYRSRMRAAFGVELPAKAVVQYSFFEVCRRSGAGRGNLTPEAEHKFSYTFRSFTEDVRGGLSVANLPEREVLWTHYDKRARVRRVELVRLEAFVRGVRAGLERPRGYHRIRWFGFLSNRKKRARLEEFGVAKVDELLDGEPTEKSDLAPVLEPCPLCGGEIFTVSRGVVLDDVDGRLWLEGMMGAAAAPPVPPVSVSSVARRTIPADGSASRGLGA